MAGSESTIGALLDETGGSIKTGPFGTKLKASEYTATGVPVISVGEVGFGRLRVHRDTPRVDGTVSSRMPEFLLKAGDIVFGRKGAVERSAQVQPDEDGYFLGSDGIRIRLNVAACDPKFISYQLQTAAHRIWMIQQAAGTTMPSLNEGIIRRIPIVLKPLAEQRAIAAVLGALDDKIELNRRMNATLEAMARALFQSWFVDFDPVRAKLDGTLGAALDPKIATHFPDRFEHIDDIVVPNGWQLTRLGDHIELQRGTTYKSMLKDLPGPYLLGLGSIHRNGGFRDDSLRTYGGESPPKLILKPGDLFVSLKDVTQAADLLGAVARVPPEISAGRLTQDTVKLVDKQTGLSRNYLYWALRHPQYRSYCRSRATGTTNLGLSREDFFSFPIIVPSPEIQKAFDVMAGPIDSLIDANRQTSRTLATLRDTLLPKLLNGQLETSAINRGELL